MKRLVTILLGIAAIGFSCRKGGVAPKNYSAILTGYDMRKCASPACGGLFITIKNDTAQYPQPYYRTSQTLAQLGISENTKFPIYVDLSYKPDTGIYNTFHYIIVTQLKVVQ